MGKTNDGVGTTITWTTNSTFVLLKISITPPELDGGGPIDLTGLDNTAWRTSAPKTLKDVNQIKFEGRMDSSLYTQAPINSNDLITITYPDTSSNAFWGWLDKLTPGDSVEGDKMMVTGIIEVSNLNGSAVETAPAYSA